MLDNKELRLLHVVALCGNTKVQTVDLCSTYTLFGEKMLRLTARENVSRRRYTSQMEVGFQAYEAYDPYVKTSD